MLLQLSLIALLPSLLALPTIQKRSTRQLIYAGRDDLCLSLQGGINTTPGNGVPVVSLPCGAASVWDISRGSGSIILSGTNFALDAGSNPGNNGALKVWQSYPGLSAQTWYLTDDARIAITGGDQCLDEGDNGVQTYQCTTGNTNQVWNVEPQNPNGPPTPSSVAASSTTSVSTPSSTPSAPSDSVARRIHPNGDSSRCVTVQNGYPGVGTTVAISDCFADDDHFANLQKWVFSTDRPGHVQLSLTTDEDFGPLCLDAGTNPANGSGMKIWNCYDNIPQQNWSFTGSGLMSTPVGQCLDVVAGSGPINRKPYGSVQDLQTWQCSGGEDPQQKFNL